MCLTELRVVYVRRTDISPDPPSLMAPRAAAVEFQMLEKEAVEVFGALYLTSHHHLIGYHEISRGCLNATLVHPRDVFKAALLTNAASVIVGHNHPSGDTTPSLEDVALTERLCCVGALLGVPVLDHIVVGRNGGYFSFREAGRIGGHVELKGG